MTFFNLKRLARLLAILLAILPISELAAASPSITQTSASNIVQDLSSQYQSDAATIVAAAGIPGALISSGTLSASTGSTLATTLAYAFNSTYTSNRLSQNKIPNLVTAAKTYISATSSATASTSTASLVSTAMQNLMSLMALTLLNIVSSDAKKDLNGQTLPLTGVAILPSSSASYDQVVVNNFVQELAAWIPYYQAVVSGNIANLNNQMLANAAKQLGLTPASNVTLAQAMQNVINAATNDSSALYGAAGSNCSNNATIQKQINCGIAWYQAQLATITANTPQIVAATTNLNTIDTNATTTITGYVTTYGPQIKAATTVSSVNSLFNTALSAINAAYPSLIGTAGTIAAQNNIVSTLETAANSAVTALTNASASTPLTAAHTAYTTAQSNFATALQTVNTDFPDDLPVSAGVGTLTATNASNYGTSVPGAQVEALATDQTNAINEINTTNNNNNNATVASVSANTTALSSALSAAQSVFTNYISGFTTAATITKAGGLTAVVTQINTYYTSTIAAKSAYAIALANANTLLSQLNSLKNATPQPTGLANAISTMSTAINDANAAFPQATPTIYFSVANSTGAGQAVGSVTAAQMVNSVPGKAIATLNNIVNPPASGGGGLSKSARNAIAGTIIALIITAVLGVVGYKIWQAKQVSEPDTRVTEAQEAIADSPATDETLTDISQLNPSDPDIEETIDSFMNSFGLVDEVQPAIMDSVETLNGLTPGSLESSSLVNPESTTPVEDATSLNGTLGKITAAGGSAQASVDAAGEVAPQVKLTSMQELESIATRLQSISDAYGNPQTAAQTETVEVTASNNSLTNPQLEQYSKVLNQIMQGPPAVTSDEANITFTDMIKPVVEVNGFSMGDMLDLVANPDVTYSGSPQTNLDKLNNLIDTISTNNIQRGTGTIDSLVDTINNPVASGPVGGNTVVPKGTPEYEKLVQQAAEAQQAANDQIKNLPMDQQEQAIDALRASIEGELKGAEADTAAEAEAAGKAKQFNDDFPNETPIEDIP